MKGRVDQRGVLKAFKRHNKLIKKILYFLIQTHILEGFYYLCMLCILYFASRFLTFNVRTNTWSEGPSMMVARKCHASLVHDNKLYVMGGSDSQVKSVLLIRSIVH